MNILMLYLDELRADAFGAAGNPLAHTPNLDRLAARSVVFRNAWGVAPVCMPSRTSLAAGRYPRQTGAMDNSMPAVEGEECYSFYRRFAESGWTLENAGKYHQAWPLERSGFSFHERTHDGFGSFGNVPPGCDPRAVRERIRRLEGDLPIVIWGESPIPEDRTEAALTVDVALRRFEGLRESGKPFFLRVATGMPHTPYAAPAPWSRLVDPADVALPPSWPDDITEKPTLVQVVHANRRYRDLTEEDIRRCRASYAGLVAHVDSQVGRVLEALEHSGLREETIVVLTADHGTCLGEHGWIEKWAQLWDETLHVPLWISVPGIAPGCSDALVQQFDLGATLLELCGAAPIEGNEARSLVPLLECPSRPHRDAVFGEVFIPAYMSEPASALRTDRWMLSDYPHPEAIESRLPGDHPCRGAALFDADRLVGGELYDRLEDPHATRNLIDSPAHVEVVASLRGRLDEWRRSCEPRVAWEDFAADPTLGGWSQQGLIEGARARRLPEIWAQPPTRRVLYR